MDRDYPAQVDGRTVWRGGGGAQNALRLSVFPPSLRASPARRDREREAERERCSEGVGLDGSLPGLGVILNTHPFFFYLTISVFFFFPVLSMQPLNHTSLLLTFCCHMHGESSIKSRAKVSWVGWKQAHSLNPQKSKSVSLWNTLIQTYVGVKIWWLLQPASYICLTSSSLWCTVGLDLDR